MISTFDSDDDGYLDFDDFVEFIKFQRALREQFFFSRAEQAPDADVDAAGMKERVVKSSSLPRLGDLCDPCFEGQVKRSSGKRRQSKSSGKVLHPHGKMGAPKSDLPTLRRLSEAAVNTISKARHALDESRGAFYSSLVSAV